MKAASQHGAEGAQFVRYFGPLLDALRALGGSGTPDEVVERIAQDLKIPDDVQNELIPSGEQRFRNQIRWARMHLAKEGLIDSSVRGIWSLTEKGLSSKLSLEAAKSIRLRQAQAYRKNGTSVGSEPVADDPCSEPETDSPQYVGDTINELRSLSSSGFERFSQRLLRESGFTQVVVTGKTGDGGIDGHGSLQFSPLLSLRAFFQCKRYKGSVSAPAVRDFRGAMAGRTDYGIIITTGTFTADAKREATREGVTPIELIDGEKLVEMLAKLELGLKAVTAYEIDEAFFEEFKS